MSSHDPRVRPDQDCTVPRRTELGELCGCAGGGIDDTTRAYCNALRLLLSNMSGNVDEAARRAEIMKKVAAAKAEREAKAKAEEAQRTEYYGEHPGISCDGCGSEGPMMGYRYRCKSCANHDARRPGPRASKSY